LILPLDAAGAGVDIVVGTGVFVLCGVLVLVALAVAVAVGAVAEEVAVAPTPAPENLGTSPHRSLTTYATWKGCPCVTLLIRNVQVTTGGVRLTTPGTAWGVPFAVTTAFAAVVNATRVNRSPPLIDAPPRRLTSIATISPRRRSATDVFSWTAGLQLAEYASSTDRRKAGQ
jgi:hypothetical protein